MKHDVLSQNYYNPSFQLRARNYPTNLFSPATCLKPTLHVSLASAMLYAVVDIETNGSNTERGRITEVAVFITDGKEVLEEFSTLVNPGKFIPNYITSLTGITNEMVMLDPPFSEIAPRLHEMLKDKVFVAHNVNFDYGFLKEEFKRCDINWSANKLCTVRLGRKIFPGFRSYGLGNLCKRLNISIYPRHRAIGDARATTTLFLQMMSRDHQQVIPQMLKRNSREATLPPNIPREKVDNLPEQAGVYYFLNAKAKVIYVGKAKNLKKRVISHFTGNSKLKKQRKFLDLVVDIDFVTCGNELIALLYECLEIKRLIPEFNRAQKFLQLNYGIYSYEDRNGYLRLAIAKNNKMCNPIYTCSSMAEARKLLMQKVSEYQLCPKLCGLQKSSGACFDQKIGQCQGACILEEETLAYNKKVNEAINSFDMQLESFVIQGKGRTSEENSIVLVEKGSFKGFGFVDYDCTIDHPSQLESYINHYPDNQDVQRILKMYLKQQHKDKIIPIV